MAERWTGGHYSLFRALLGVYLVLHFSMLLPYGDEVFSRLGALSDAGSSPYFGLLPNPLWLDDSPATVAWLLVFGAACGVCLILGWGDRAAAIGAALILGWLYQRNPLIANPSLPLLGWMLVFHLFVPARPYGSVAGALHGSGTQWRLPRHLRIAAWVMLALCYSHSGWTKLASPSWTDGETIRLVLENPLARDHLLRDWLLATPPLVLQALTWLVLLVELLFAPLSLSRRLRPYLWLAMLSAQLGFLVLLDFADLTFPMLLAHLLTFDPAWLSARERHAPAVVLFDGDCAMCDACVRLALHEDALERLRFAPLNGPAAQRLLGADPPPHGGESIVVIDAAGETSTRSRAVVAILERLGGAWLLPAALLRCVPIAIADAGYDLVGRWRYRFGGRRAADACHFPQDGVGRRML